MLGTTLGHAGAALLRSFTSDSLCPAQDHRLPTTDHCHRRADFGLWTSDFGLRSRGLPLPARWCCWSASGSTAGCSSWRPRRRSGFCWSWAERETTKYTNHTKQLSRQRTTAEYADYADWAGGKPFSCAPCISWFPALPLFPRNPRNPRSSSGTSPFSVSVVSRSCIWWFLSAFCFLLSAFPLSRRAAVGKGRDPFERVWFKVASPGQGKVAVRRGTAQNGASAFAGGGVSARLRWQPPGQRQ